MNLSSRTLPWLLTFPPLVILAAAPAAAPTAKYDPGPLAVADVVKKPDATAIQQIVGLAKQTGIKEIRRGGATEKLLWSATDAKTDALAASERHERVALYALVQRAGMAGVEGDILVPGADGARIPVTILWEVSGVVSVTSGPPVKELLKTDVTAADVQARYGVGPFTAQGTAWKPQEIAAVDQALSLLTKEELALAQGFGFHRLVTGPPGRRAHYHRQDSGMTIDVFDTCFIPDAEAFIGPVDAPVADSVGILLHEFAHAISDHHGRQNAIKANTLVAEFKALQEKQKATPTPEGKAELKAKFEAAGTLRKQNNAMDLAQLKKTRAAERAFAAVLDPKVSVTVYGRTTTDENLAEAFRLYKADPAALTRIAPAALEWFKAGNLATVAAKPLE